MVLTFFGTTLVVYALMFAAQTDPVQALAGDRPVSPATRDYLTLPALVLSSLSLATALRLTSTSVAENLRADYVRTARAKGLSPRRVIGVHVLRNSLIPVVTFIGVELGNLMAGAVVTERIFNI